MDGQIDYLFFFTDPMTLQPHDTDVKALTRLAGVENIVFCCNRSTADHIISSPLFMDPDYERIHPDYSSYTKRFQDKPVVTEAVESVNRRKKKRKLKKSVKKLLILIPIIAVIAIVCVYGFALKDVSYSSDLQQYSAEEVKAYLCLLYTSFERR